MATQQLCRFLTFFTALFLTFYILLGLPATSGAQQACPPDGDVDQNGSVTAADSLLAFQQALRLVELNACRRTIADVFPQPSAPDGNISAADALCIFQKALRLPSCLDIQLPPNEPPVANAGPDRSVEEGMAVTLSGAATDPDGTIERYAWTQVGGAAVSLQTSGTQNAWFTAPDVDTSVTLTFRFDVTDDDGATNSDDVRVEILPVERLMISVSGTVRDYDTDEWIPGAAIRVTQYHGGVARDLGTTYADEDGIYEIDVTAHPGRVNVEVDAEHFSPQSVIVNVTEDSGSTYVDIVNLPVDVVHEFRSTDDAEIANQDHTLVSVAAGSLVTDDGREPSGDITAMVTVLDASMDTTVMPGDFQTLNEASGILEPIESYGAMNIRFMDDNGESLNLRSGRLAEISIPLAEARDPAGSPATLPMYFWSDELSYWIEEGSAALEQVSPGKWAYAGRVGHFTTWNADARYPSIRIRGCVVDDMGNPVPAATVTATGIDYIGSSSTTTNFLGEFEVQARPNSTVVISAMEDGRTSVEFSLSTGDEWIELNNCLLVSLLDPVTPPMPLGGNWLCLAYSVTSPDGQRLLAFDHWETDPATGYLIAYGFTFPDVPELRHPTLGTGFCTVCRDGRIVGSLLDLLSGPADPGCALCTAFPACFADDQNDLHGGETVLQIVETRMTPCVPAGDCRPPDPDLFLLAQ